MPTRARKKITSWAFYTIAVQKAQALRQENFFGRPISLLPPQPVAELWETVAAFALDRGMKGLTLDGENETPAIGKTHSPGRARTRVPASGARASNRVEDYRLERALCAPS